jgi:hypothetical protein
MDLASALQQLYAQRQKLDRVIAALETLRRAPSPPLPPSPSSGKRRGRKSMSADERKEVSKRMKKYWANRRKTHVGQQERV